MISRINLMSVDWFCQYITHLFFNPRVREHSWSELRDVIKLISALQGVFLLPVDIFLSFRTMGSNEMDYYKFSGVKRLFFDRLCYFFCLCE